MRITSYKISSRSDFFKCLSFLSKVILSDVVSYMKEMQRNTFNSMNITLGIALAKRLFPCHDVIRQDSSDDSQRSDMNNPFLYIHRSVNKYCVDETLL